MTMHRLTRLFAAALVGAVAATPGYAQDTGEVIAEIGYLVQKKKAIETKRDQNVELKREIESAFEELATEQTWIGDESAQIDAEEQQLNQEIDSYNSYCTGTFEEPEYTIRSNWCNANSAPLDSRGASLGQRIDNYNATIDAYNERYDWLTAQDDQRVADAEALKREYDSVVMRLDALEQILRLSDFADQNQDCVNKPSREAMHQCMQASWDGANAME